MHGLPQALLISSQSGPPPGANFVFVAGSSTGAPDPSNTAGWQVGWAPPAQVISGNLFGFTPARFADVQDSGHIFEIIVPCSITPANFTSILIFELGLTLTHIGMTFVAGCGQNIFKWPLAGLVFGSTYHVYVTP